MKTLSASILPPNIVRCMSAADRKSIGAKTPEEIKSAYEDAGEKQLQRLCEQELTRRGITYLHLSCRAREKVGWPDLTFCCRKVPMAVELKTATGRLSQDQTTMLSRMSQDGWRVHVVRSFEEFRAVLDGQTASGSVQK